MGDDGADEAKLDESDEDESADGTKEDDDAEDDSEENEEDETAKEPSYLLGSKEDKSALRDVIKQFSRDDLADTGDEIVAAVRMQIHRLSAMQRHLRVCCTLGIYLLFQAREDQGVLLLTRRGRVINAGMSHLSEATQVTGYACKVIFNIMIMAAIITGAVVTMSRSVEVEAKLVVTVAALLVVTVTGLCLWGSRPRKDCGSDFRQHFNVADLCVGSYNRVDHWACCTRRRKGHLRLCFGRYYPDSLTLEEGLPQGTPNMGCMVPVQRMGAAVAGEAALSASQEEHQSSTARREANGRSHEGLSPLTAFILALLGLVAGFYEYIAVVSEVDSFGAAVCRQKVKGCTWKVPNPTNLLRRMDGANPPHDYLDPGHNSGCDKEGEYCDVYWQKMDYCSPENREAQIVEVKLTCEELDNIKRKLNETIDNSTMSKISYEIRQKFDLWTISVPGLPRGGNISLLPGMKLVKIGPSTTAESQSLRNGKRLNWSEVKRHCNEDQAFTGAMRFVFRKEVQVVDLQDSDCEQLEKACQAQSFGPDMNGWMPPSHLLDWTKTRTMCWMIRPDWAEKLHGQVFWHVVESLESLEEGLTCAGPPRQIRRVGEHNVTGCQKECEERQWCRYVFHKDPSEPFTTEAWDFASSLWNFTTSDLDNCLLYAECPAVERSLESNLLLGFERVSCGNSIGAHDWDWLPYSAVERRGRRHFGPNASVECMKACVDARNRTCNAFSTGAGYCALYGNDQLWSLLEDEAGWEWLGIQKIPIFEDGDSCWIRRPALPRNPDRVRTGTSGQLFRRSDHRYCKGCGAVHLASYIFEWQNFATILGQLISIVGFAFIARKASYTQAWKSNAFTGKPIIDFEIVYDPRNRENFLQRESAYMAFLTYCTDLKRGVDSTPAVNRAGKLGQDCWDWDDDEYARVQGETKVVPVVGKSFDDYELTDLRMRTCYVDRGALGLLPEERVMGAWPERRRIGLWKLPLLLLLFLALVICFESVIPPEWEYGWPAHVKSQVYVVTPLIIMLVFYAEYRQGINGLCVVTNAGRIMQITRQPLRFVCPRLFSKQAIRVDSFHIGTVLAAQLDMHVVPHFCDQLHEWPALAGRRGKVTIRGAHGFLELHRLSGDAFVIFHAMSTLVDSKRVHGLPQTPSDDSELYGVCPHRDIQTPEESHVWTRRFDSCGFYADPFNYSALLTITDHRSIFVRARMPKPFSLRGLLVGPRTCGNHCFWLQDLLDHTPYLTVCTLGHNHLESYATQRKRAPPFWPGLLPPVTSCTVSLLPRFMRTYPSGFAISQRPYGLKRQVTTEREVVLTPSRNGKLQVDTSWIKGAPRGTVVEVVNGSLSEMLLSDGTDEIDVEPGSSLVLEAASEEWGAIADEAWLAELRMIYDLVLRRKAEDGENVTFDLDEGVPPPRHGCLARIWAWVVGADMLGWPHGLATTRRTAPPRHSDSGSGSDSESESQSYKLM